MSDDKKGGSRVAVITARGGSKRIPGKNKKDFLGRPIIDYSIRAALDSEIFDLVMVSTDDEEIAQIAQNAGAQVPFLRSEKTANDFATTADVMEEVTQELKKMGKRCCACVISAEDCPTISLHCDTFSRKDKKNTYWIKQNTHGRD